VAAQLAKRVLVAACHVKRSVWEKVTVFFVSLICHFLFLGVLISLGGASSLLGPALLVPMLRQLQLDVPVDYVHVGTTGPSIANALIEKETRLFALWQNRIGRGARLGLMGLLGLGVCRHRRRMSFHVAVSDFLCYDKLEISSFGWRTVAVLDVDVQLQQSLGLEGSFAERANGLRNLGGDEGGRAEWQRHVWLLLLSRIQEDRRRRRCCRADLEWLCNLHTWGGCGQRHRHTDGRRRGRWGRSSVHGELYQIVPGFVPH